MRLPRAGGLLAVAVGLAACSGITGAEAPAGVDAPDGYRVGVVSTDLTGPTQVAVGPDGRLWVAELNGAEDEAAGRVVALADDGTVDETLLADLDKPTGIAVLDGHLWVMQRRSLGRAPITAGDRVGPLEILLEELPFNGRSESSLTVTPAGTLLYATTGSAPGGDVREGSGILWELEPDRPTEPVPYATGFKNAYAHVVDGDAVVTTEIGDGSYDGQAPPDELVRVERGGDGGWPQCIGDGTPVDEYGGDADRCAGTAPSLALFPPRATPTGLARYDDGWIVALWTRSEVVRVPFGGGEPTPWLTGLEGPQDLLVDGATLLVTDHLAGRLVAVEPA